MGCNPLTIEDGTWLMENTLPRWDRAKDKPIPFKLGQGKGKTDTKPSWAKTRANRPRSFTI